MFRDDNVTNTIQYSIRIDFHEIPDTEKTSDNDDGLDGNKDYFETGTFLSSFPLPLFLLFVHSLFILFLGFLTLQNGIDGVLLSLENNETTTLSPTVLLFAFNKPKMWERYLTNADIFEILGPIFIVLALFISNFR